MHVLGITERVCLLRAVVLGLAPESGAATAVALADRSIIVPFATQAQQETQWIPKFIN